MNKRIGKRQSFKLEEIKDSESMRISLSKRKKGLIKKCIELSIMHNQDIFMFMFDKTQQRLTEFRSDPQMNSQVA